MHLSYQQIFFDEQVWIYMRTGCLAILSWHLVIYNYKMEMKKNNNNLWPMLLLYLFFLKESIKGINMFLDITIMREYLFNKASSNTTSHIH